MKKSNKTIVPSVVDLVVTNLLSSDISKDRLKELIFHEYDDTDSLLRVCSYLNGTLTIPTFSKEKECNGKHLIFESYDVFQDNVFYSYEEDKTRYFDSESKANQWLMDPAPYQHAGESHESGNYVFPATRTFTNRDWCSASRWEEYKDWDEPNL